MTHFFICRLGSDQSLYRPQSLHLGSVEVRPPRFDSPREKEALVQSVTAFGENLNLQVVPRFVTIVEAKELRDAMTVAEARFEEAADALDFAQQGISDFTLQKAGYSRDLCSGLLTHLEPSIVAERRAEPSLAFHIVAETHPRIEFAEALFVAGRTELVQRLLRSVHWSRKARWELNIQLRVLHRWFAMEAAWKRDEQDSIISIGMLALGFPIGRDGLSFRPEILATLEALPRYGGWKKRVETWFDGQRKWRNDCVHSGFRPWDVSIDDMRWYDLISTLSCGRAQRLLVNCIELGITTIDAARSGVAALVDKNPDFINDMENILYSLEHRT